MTQTTNRAKIVEMAIRRVLDHFQITPQYLYDYVQGAEAEGEGIRYGMLWWIVREFRYMKDVSEGAKNE